MPGGAVRAAESNQPEVGPSCETFQITAGAVASAAPGQVKSPRLLIGLSATISEGWELNIQTGGAACH